MRTPDPPIPPLRAAVLAQVFGLAIAAGLVALAYPPLFGRPLVVAALQGASAAYVGHKLESPGWWIPIHLAFGPCVVAAYGLGLAPGWYLAMFILLFLVYWRIDRSRVPLYLSNEAAARAVASLLPAYPCRVIDLGCGNGVLLARLAEARPDCQFFGIEHAPLPWVWAMLVSVRHPNCRVRLGSFWNRSLADYAVIYAFLSPAPMPRLWAKASAEMTPDALFITNSFPVPGVAPEREVLVGDRAATRLYCYRPAPQGSQ
ncbi:MAG TPA: class I SAM-dependent methyltransferase [Rhodocyclaceae bacterium]|nr:class I SAM-dependent methyltransferase [Rhodocyclaceae bacterium]